MDKTIKFALSGGVVAVIAALGVGGFFFDKAQNPEKPTRRSARTKLQGFMVSTTRTASSPLSSKPRATWGQQGLRS